MSSPDLVIGVDFGTTHTKVAWTNLRNEIVTIRYWTSRADSIEAVPSKLQYGPNREVKNGAFYATMRRLKTKFVNLLRNTGDAIRLVSDYLRQVYRHTKSSIEDVVGPWGDKNIEFIFSYPSTWQALSTTNNFLEAIRAAGFGQESLKHRVTLELTSAEAVAVYAVSTPASKFEDGDILIVCNASGATTEVGLFELFDSNPMHPRLRQVNAVTGVGNGSITIDQEFQKLVQQKLDLYGSDTQIANHQDFSIKLAQSKVFQSIKHRFGTTDGDISEYEITLHNLSLGITRDFCQPALRIDKGRMIFSRAEIQTIFDQIIGRLYQLIDNQLLQLRENRDSEQVTIVLNGGFGTSVYLYKQLQKKYASTSISVIISEEPILAEVKGLVIDRKQKLLTRAPTLKSRVARASYGVLCRQVYDSKIHLEAHIVLDPYNKRLKWAVNQIEWIIRKGDTLETDSARERAFSEKIVPGDPNRHWITTIVISHNDRDSLPRMMDAAGVFKLCNVKMDLSGVSERDFEERNKRFWQGKRFFLATFYLRVIVAPADLRFELWFKGKPYTSSIDPVTVEWDPAGASAKPMSHSTVWGTVKPSALRDSQIGMSSERRVGSTIQPQNLRDSIYTGDVQETQSLLESDFDSVAKDDFAWLRELKDLNYPERDIAELLINSEKDSPWIYFEPTANIDRSIIPGYHQPACVHFDRRRSPNSREIVGSPFTFANRRLIPTAGSLAEPTSSTNLSWSTDEESVMCIIDELCGIAGVCPDKRDLDKWTGQVLFSDDYPEMIASVTYRPNSKSLDTSQPSELDRAGTSVGHTESKDRDRALRDIVTVLERFCSAAAQSQQNGLCCDSFTILKKLRDTQGDAIDLTRVDLKLAVDLLDELKASRLDSDRNILPVSTAKSICELFLGSLSLGVHDIDATLDLCSLAAQLLTLGFALYARAHVDTFCPFFLDTPVYGVYLFGARDLSSGYPQAAVTLHRFTCLNDMIEKPVMVFSKFSDDVENSGAFPLDLLATSTDLLDTWGPGRFVEPPNRTAPESLSIIGILLGNGIIQPADEVGDPSNLTLHWSKEISPVHASAKKFTWNKDAKMRIAGSVIVNENCQADLKLLWPLFTQALENRGAYQDYWAFTEFQAGLAIAGQQFIGGQLQFNKTWTWHDGNSWKQNFLALLALDMPFDELERPWGLQVSFCTGVSRRVPLRVLLADVMPIFVQTLSLPPEWTVLEEQGIFKAFEGENLKAWLDSLNLLPKSQHLIPLVKRIVHYTLLILKDTGVDRTEQKFRIACPKNLVSGKPLAMCLEIPCNNGNLWTRILADTKDCATFACMTPLCLESEEHKCRQTDPWHCPSLQTAVCRYRAKDELLGVPVAGSPWRLQDQALYWIGNPKSGLQTRMKMSQDGKTARLHVSVSSMSEKTLSQLGTMRLLSKMGRKMDHIREKQYEDWEAEGVLVMADIKP